MWRMAWLLFVTAGFLPASTIEVVKLYQPLSLHGTDGTGEFEGGGPSIQAVVLSRPFAVSGAIPEDLVRAIAEPYRIASNNPEYTVRDANLLSICKIALTTELKGGRLLVRFDVTNLDIPEEVDLSSREILRLAIQAVRRTVRDYYQGSGEGLEVSVGILGTRKGNETLKDLATRFSVTG